MNGWQSVLAAAGPEAASVATLFWVMIAGAVAIFALVIAALAVALWAGPHWRRAIGADRAILAGGLVLPVVVLSALLAYGLSLTGMRTGGTDPAALRIVVVGEQWWWRVTYEGPQGPLFETANEIVLPVGKPVQMELASADVIHSFWVPSIAGKLDMIPGRTNRLTVTASAAGRFRGQCAEYCGGPHAFMAFTVRSVPEEDFAAWVTAQTAPAVAPHTATGEQGRALFAANGCAACHRIRGVTPAGTIGPDLTHLADRTTLGAGVLPNTPAALARWISGSQSIKPENGMPDFRIFAPDELAALVTYLSGLK